jgi:replicative DNA helicase
MKEFDALPEGIVEVGSRPRPITDYLEEYYGTLGDGEVEYIGLRTGFEGLDRATLGLDGVIVLGGIAGVGKTSLALQISVGVCELGTPTLYYSLEMPRRAIITKILSRLAKVRYGEILLKGRRYLTEQELEEEDFYRLLSKEQAERLKEARDRLCEIGSRFYVRTREQGEAEINFEVVEQEINFLKAEHRVERVFVVIDHLQVFNVERYSDQIDKENRLIAGFKGISERTNATMLLISQKNKAGFYRTGLQAIKGSVDIVYLADVVMFLEGENGEKQGEEEEYIAHLDTARATPIDLVIDKNRYGAPRTIKLLFNGQYSDFTEREEER